MNLLKQYGMLYLEKGYSVIPDKWGSKAAAIKGYTRFSEEMPLAGDIENWSNSFDRCNLALMTGGVSGVIALDVDTENAQILEIIEKTLPHSPVEKRGAKGFTRFFRYKGETSHSFKLNGEMVFEILSEGKKTTLPPSLHPSGLNYKWEGKSLLEVSREELPLLPPFLIPNMENVLISKFPDLVSNGKKAVSGRNDALSSLAGQLIGEMVPVDQAIARLVQFDKENHTPPLFTDPEEMRHTEPFTNALLFFTNHLCTVNTKHFRKNEAYEVPITASAIENLQMPKKKTGKSKEKRAVTCPHCGMDIAL